MRTTVDIEEPILSEVKELQRKEGVSLGRLVSDLLALALHVRRSEKSKAPEQPHWISRGLGARLNFDDKERLYAVMEDMDAELRNGSE